MSGINRRAILVMLCLVVAGCSQRDLVLERIDKIGAARLVTQATTVLEGVAPGADQGMRNREVPASLWPAAVRELQPEAVRVSEEGMFIRMEHTWVEEAGIFIPFEGRTPVKGPGDDPSFEKVSDRVFWYNIKG